MIIDVHSHFYPRPYLEQLMELNRGDASVWGRSAARTLSGQIKEDQRMWDIEAHLGDMDAAGVDVDVLSLSVPHPYFDEPTPTVELAHLGNNGLAEVCARYPH